MRALMILSAAKDPLHGRPHAHHGARSKIRMIRKPWKGAICDGF
jgi:hypothetical protein